MDFRYGSRQAEHLMFVPSFAAFVATKDPAEEYDWPDRAACPAAQYARDIGCYEEWLEPPTVESYRFWEGLNRLARPGLGVVGTFGQLAQRLDNGAQYLR